MWECAVRAYDVCGMCDMCDMCDACDCVCVCDKLNPHAYLCIHAHTPRNMASNTFSSSAIQYSVYGCVCECVCDVCVQVCVWCVCECDVRVMVRDACDECDEWRMMYDAWCMMYDVWCMMYDVWCMMYDVWCMMYDVWCMMYDVWNMMYDVWCMMMYDAWCMMHDVWCMMYGVWWYLFGIPSERQIFSPQTLLRPLWEPMCMCVYARDVLRILIFANTGYCFCLCPI